MKPGVEWSFDIISSIIHVCVGVRILQMLSMQGEVPPMSKLELSKQTRLLMDIFELAWGCWSNIVGCEPFMTVSIHTSPVFRESPKPGATSDHETSPRKYSEQASMCAGGAECGKYSHKLFLNPRSSCDTAERRAHASGGHPSGHQAVKGWTVLCNK